jgi:hypothetical protein
MTTVISGSSPSITFSDATTQTTAFTSTPSVTSITTSADSTIHGVTVGLGAGSIATNTAVGASALAANTTGAFNTAVGNIALNTNLTGLQNVAVGHGSLYTNKADYNVAVGVNALNANSTGANNTALGTNALLVNLASNNTAVGYQAGYTNTTGVQSNYVGRQAGYTSNASYCTMMGDQAGYASTGTINTFIGYYAGGLITSGAKNTILGGFNGNQNGVDIRTTSNKVAISDGDGNVRYFHDGSATGLLYPNISSSPTFFYAWDTARFYPNPDNSLNLGLGSNRFNTVYASNGTINTSDRNEKQDIQNLSAFELAVAQEIKSLFKTYRWKSAVAEKGDAARIHVGVIAQDVQEAFAKHGLDATRYALWCSDTWYEVDGKASPTAAEPFTAETPDAVLKTRLGIRYDQLLAFVISAM